jgi:hypothetical protein
MATMPLPVIDDVFRVAVLWQDANSPQTAVNVMHVFADTGTPTSVAAGLDAAANAGMFAAMSNAIVATEFAITPLDGSSATEFFTPDPAKWTGQTSGDYAPQVAALVKLRTGLRGRSKRGRVFLPFTAEGAQSNGTLTGSKVTTMQTEWDAFVAQLLSDNNPLVVASYKLASSANVTSEVVESETGTQRRRQTRNR